MNAAGSIDTLSRQSVSKTRNCSEVFKFSHGTGLFYCVLPKMPEVPKKHKTVIHMAYKFLDLSADVSVLGKAINRNIHQESL